MNAVLGRGLGRGLHREQGDKDLVKAALQKRGSVHFGRVLMKPGKPLTFATIDAAGGWKLLVFGLPGNPVSSLVTFQLVLVPVLRKLMGQADPSLRRLRVYTMDELPLDAQRPEYHRVWLSWSDSRGAFVAKSTGGQRSSRLLSMRSANGLLLLPQVPKPYTLNRLITCAPRNTCTR